MKTLGLGLGCLLIVCICAGVLGEKRATEYAFLSQIQMVVSFAEIRSMCLDTTRPKLSMDKAMLDLMELLYESSDFYTQPTDGNNLEAFFSADKQIEITETGLLCQRCDVVMNPNLTHPSKASQLMVVSKNRNHRSYLRETHAPENLGQPGLPNICAFTNVDPQMYATDALSDCKWICMVDVERYFGKYPDGTFKPLHCGTSRNSELFGFFCLGILGGLFLVPVVLYCFGVFENRPSSVFPCFKRSI